MVTAANRYDVIIMGAGSAGCVLATRLSEDLHRSVLLLEAGPDYPDQSLLPPDIASGFCPTVTHDWGFTSEPDVLGRSIMLPRGKIMGGCSSTNGTWALRGTPEDYDEWAALGDSGWSFADVLPTFCRAETDLDMDNEWHGKNGPLPIRRYPPEERTPIHAAFLDSCVNVGFATVADHNAPGALGVGPIPVNCIEGKRQSAAIAYLAAARGRPNLHIRPDSAIDRVIFEGNRAVGVSLSGSRETVSGDHVIVAGGTYGSPAILMRSGLGPATHLRDVGVDVIQDMPGVGENLIDHAYVGLLFAAPQEVLEENPPWFQVTLTARSSGWTAGHDLHIAPTCAFSQPADNSPTGAQFVFLVSVVKPHSHGRVQLRSADPASLPRIDMGYFSHPGDMPRHIEAVRWGREIARTAPLSDLIVANMYPASGVGDSDEELERVIRERIETYHHPVGTCRMGPSGDDEAVVDARGRVHGMEGLSVVDASIMPTVPAANTNLPTIMVAERVAAWMTQDL